MKHKHNYFSCASDLAPQLEIRQGLSLSGVFSYVTKICVNLGIFSTRHCKGIEQLSKISRIFLVSLWANPRAGLGCAGASWTEIKQEITWNCGSWWGWGYRTGERICSHQGLSLTKQWEGQCWPCCLGGSSVGAAAAAIKHFISTRGEGLCWDLILAALLMSLRYHMVKFWILFSALS